MARLKRTAISANPYEEFKNVYGKTEAYGALGGDTAYKDALNRDATADSANAFIGTVMELQNRGGIDAFKSEYNTQYLTDYEKLIAAENELFGDRDTLNTYTRYKKDEDGEYVFDDNGNYVEEEYEDTSYNYMKEYLAECSQAGLERAQYQAEEEERKNMSVWEKIGRGVGSIVSIIPNMTAKAIDTFLGGFTFLGNLSYCVFSGDWEFLRTTNYTYLSDLMQGWDKSWTLNYDAHGNVNQFGNMMYGVSNTLGQMLPTYGMQAAIGAVGKAANMSTKAMTTMSKVVGMTYWYNIGYTTAKDYMDMSPEVPTWACCIAGFSVAAIQAGVTYMMSQTIGMSNLDAKTLGVSEDVGSILSKGIIKSGAKAGLAQFFKDFAAEGYRQFVEEEFQEIGQYLVEGAANLICGQCGVDFNMVMDITPQQMLNACVMAYVTSGITTATGYVKTAINGRQKSNLYYFDENGKQHYTKLGVAQSMQITKLLQNSVQRGQNINDIIKNTEKTKADLSNKSEAKLRAEVGNLVSTVKVLEQFFGNLISQGYTNEDITKSIQVVEAISKNLTLSEEIRNAGGTVAYVNKNIISKIFKDYYAHGHEVAKKLSRSGNAGATVKELLDSDGKDLTYTLRSKTEVAGEVESTEPDNGTLNNGDTGEEEPTAFPTDTEGESPVTEQPTTKKKAKQTTKTNQLPKGYTPTYGTEGYGREGTTVAKDLTPQIEETRKLTEADILGTQQDYKALLKARSENDKAVKKYNEDFNTDTYQSKVDELTIKAEDARKRQQAAIDNRIQDAEYMQKLNNDVDKTQKALNNYINNYNKRKAKAEENLGKLRDKVIKANGKVRADLDWYYQHLNELRYYQKQAGLPFEADMLNDYYEEFRALQVEGQEYTRPDVLTENSPDVEIETETETEEYEQTDIFPEEPEEPEEPGEIINDYNPYEHTNDWRRLHSEVDDGDPTRGMTPDQIKKVTKLRVKEEEETGKSTWQQEMDDLDERIRKATNEEERRRLIDERYKKYFVKSICQQCNVEHVVILDGGTSAVLANVKGNNNPALKNDNNVIFIPEQLYEMYKKNSKDYAEAVAKTVNGIYQLEVLQDIAYSDNVQIKALITAACSFYEKTHNVIVTDDEQPGVGKVNKYNVVANMLYDSAFLECLMVECSEDIIRTITQLHNIYSYTTSSKHKQYQVNLAKVESTLKTALRSYFINTESINYAVLNELDSVFSPQEIRDIKIKRNIQTFCTSLYCDGIFELYNSDGTIKPEYKGMVQLFEKWINESSNINADEKAEYLKALKPTKNELKTGKTSKTYGPIRQKLIETYNKSLDKISDDAIQHYTSKYNYIPGKDTSIALYYDRAGIGENVANYYLINSGYFIYQLIDAYDNFDALGVSNPINKAVFNYLKQQDNTLPDEMINYTTRYDFEKWLAHELRVQTGNEYEFYLYAGRNGTQLGVRPSELRSSQIDYSGGGLDYVTLRLRSARDSAENLEDNVYRNTGDVIDWNAKVNVKGNRSIETFRDLHDSLIDTDYLDRTGNIGMKITINDIVCNTNLISDDIRSKIIDKYNLPDEEIIPTSVAYIFLKQYIMDETHGQFGISVTKNGQFVYCAMSPTLRDLYNEDSAISEYGRKTFGNNRFMPKDGMNIRKALNLEHDPTYQDWFFDCVNIKYITTKESLYGRYSHDTHTIEININSEYFTNVDDATARVHMYDTLIHEFTHAIQQYNGYATGNTSNLFTRMDNLTQIMFLQDFIDYVPELFIKPDGSSWNEQRDGNLYDATSAYYRYASRIANEYLYCASAGEFEASGRYLSSATNELGENIGDFFGDKANVLPCVIDYDGSGNVVIGAPWGKTYRYISQFVSSNLEVPIKQNDDLNLKNNETLRYNVNTPEGENILNKCKARTLLLNEFTPGENDTLDIIFNEGETIERNPLSDFFELSQNNYRSPESLLNARTKVMEYLKTKEGKTAREKSLMVMHQTYMPDMKYEDFLELEVPFTRIQMNDRIASNGTFISTLIGTDDEIMYQLKQMYKHREEVGNTAYLFSKNMKVKDILFYYGDESLTALVDTDKFNLDADRLEVTFGRNDYTGDINMYAVTDDTPRNIQLPVFVNPNINDPSIKNIDIDNFGTQVQIGIHVLDNDGNMHVEYRQDGILIIQQEDVNEPYKIMLLDSNSRIIAKNFGDNPNLNAASFVYNKNRTSNFKLYYNLPDVYRSDLYVIDTETGKFTDDFELIANESKGYVEYETNNFAKTNNMIYTRQQYERYLDTHAKLVAKEVFDRDVTLQGDAAKYTNNPLTDVFDTSGDSLTEYIQKLSIREIMDSRNYLIDLYVEAIQNRLDITDAIIERVKLIDTLLAESDTFMDITNGWEFKTLTELLNYDGTYDMFDHSKNAAVSNLELNANEVTISTSLTLARHAFVPTVYNIIMALINVNSHASFEELEETNQVIGAQLNKNDVNPTQIKVGLCNSDAFYLFNLYEYNRESYNNICYNMATHTDNAYAKDAITKFDIRILMDSLTDAIYQFINEDCEEINILYAENSDFDKEEETGTVEYEEEGVLNPFEDNEEEQLIHYKYQNNEYFTLLNIKSKDGNDYKYDTWYDINDPSNIATDDEAMILGENVYETTNEGVPILVERDTETGALHEEFFNFISEKIMNRFLDNIANKYKLEEIRNTFDLYRYMTEYAYEIIPEEIRSNYEDNDGSTNFLRYLSDKGMKELLKKYGYPTEQEFLIGDDNTYASNYDNTLKISILLYDLCAGYNPNVLTSIDELLLINNIDIVEDYYIFTTEIDRLKASCIDANQEILNNIDSVAEALHDAYQKIVNNEYRDTINSNNNGDMGSESSKFDDAELRKLVEDKSQTTTIAGTKDIFLAKGRFINKGAAQGTNLQPIIDKAGSGTEVQMDPALQCFIVGLDLNKTENELTTLVKDGKIRTVHDVTEYAAHMKLSGSTTDSQAKINYTYNRIAEFFAKRQNRDWNSAGFASMLIDGEIPGSILSKLGVKDYNYEEYGPKAPYLFKARAIGMTMTAGVRQGGLGESKAYVSKYKIGFKNGVCNLDNIVKEWKQNHPKTYMLYCKFLAGCDKVGTIRVDEEGNFNSKDGEFTGLNYNQGDMIVKIMKVYDDTILSAMRIGTSVKMDAIDLSLRVHPKFNHRGNNNKDSKSLSETIYTGKDGSEVTLQDTISSVEDTFDDEYWERGSYPELYAAYDNRPEMFEKIIQYTQYIYGKEIQREVEKEYGELTYNNTNRYSTALSKAIYEKAGKLCKDYGVDGAYNMMVEMENNPNLTFEEIKIKYNGASRTSLQANIRTIGKWIFDKTTAKDRARLLSAYKEANKIKDKDFQLFTKEGKIDPKLYVGKEYLKVYALRQSLVALRDMLKDDINQEVDYAKELTDVTKKLNKANNKLEIDKAIAERKNAQLERLKKQNENLKKKVTKLEAKKNSGITVEISHTVAMPEKLAQILETAMDEPVRTSKVNQDNQKAATKYVARTINGFITANEETFRTMSMQDWLDIADFLGSDSTYVITADNSDGASTYIMYTNYLLGWLLKKARSGALIFDVDTIEKLNKAYASRKHFGGGVEGSISAVENYLNPERLLIRDMIARYGIEYTDEQVDKLTFALGLASTDKLTLITRGKYANTARFIDQNGNTYTGLVDKYGREVRDVQGSVYNPETYDAAISIQELTNVFSQKTIVDLLYLTLDENQRKKFDTDVRAKAEELFNKEAREADFLTMKRRDLMQKEIQGLTADDVKRGVFPTGSIKEDLQKLMEKGYSLEEATGILATSDRNSWTYLTTEQREARIQEYVNMIKYEDANVYQYLMPTNLIYQSTIQNLPGMNGLPVDMLIVTDQMKRWLTYYAVQDIKQTALDHINTVKGKQSIQARLIAFQQACMLSSPGTWLRNIMSNVTLRGINSAGAYLEQLLEKSCKPLAKKIKEKSAIVQERMRGGKLNGVMDNLRSAKYKTADEIREMFNNSDISYTDADIAMAVYIQTIFPVRSTRAYTSELSQDTIDENNRIFIRDSVNRKEFDKIYAVERTRYNENKNKNKGEFNAEDAILNGRSCIIDVHALERLGFDTTQILTESQQEKGDVKYLAVSTKQLQHMEEQLLHNLIVENEGEDRAGIKHAILYKIIGTKVSGDMNAAVDALLETPIYTDPDTGKNYDLWSTINAGLTRYSDDMRRSTKNEKPLADKYTMMIIDKFSREIVDAHKFDAVSQTKAAKAAGKSLNMICSWMYKMMSDNPFIKKRATYYFTRMLTELEIDPKNVNIKNGDVMDAYADAYVEAAWEYMHKGNFMREAERDVLNRWGENAWFLFKEIFPFGNASMNWAISALECSPYGLIKGIYQLVHLDKTYDKNLTRGQKFAGEPTANFTLYNARVVTGRGIIGTLLMALGACMAGLGIFRIDKDDDQIKIYFGNDVYLDVSDVFGTSAFLAGAGIIYALADDDNETFGSKVKASFTAVLDSLMKDNIIATFIESSKYDETFADYCYSLAVSTVGNFLPAMGKSFNAILLGVLQKAGIAGDIQYASGLLGQLERVSTNIPGFGVLIGTMGYGYQYDPFTGEKKCTYKFPILCNMLNKLTPVNLDAYKYSELELMAMDLGLNKQQLNGKYEDIGDLTQAQVSLLNQMYGKLNKNDLTAFFNNKTSYTVQAADGSYVTLTYRKMTNEQRANVVNRIMTNNAKYAKIYIYTKIMGGKYYATQTEFDELKKLNIRTRVFLETKKYSGFY